MTKKLWSLLAPWALALAVAGCPGGGDDEICNDGNDNDGNGQVDCADAACAADPACGEICDDGQDNDGNGQIDCADAACAADPACSNRPNGDSCGADAECGGAFCISEPDNGFPSGYCSEVCDLAANTCANGGVCLDVGAGDGTGICFDDCATDTDCRGGYTCLDVFGDGTTNICFPGCTDDAQCSTTGHCNVDPASQGVGFCSTVEDCANGVDDDGDGAVDCADVSDDTSCAQDAGCAQQIGDACNAAVTLQAGDTTGDTTNGTNLFTASCTGEGPENVFSFTPAGSGAGTLTFTLVSDADLGVYARSACEDGNSELGCADVDFGAGATETLTIAANGGTPLAVFVDGFTADEFGPYTLTVTFVLDVCGDNIVGASEDCDPADGVTCGNDCQFLPESLCNDLVDQDQDGLFDCEDPDCSAQCVSGNTPTGGACLAQTDCQSSNNDPFCIAEGDFGFPGGSCSEFCNLAANDCAGDGACLDIGLPSGNGICFDGCTIDTDCSAGYACNDIGDGVTLVCLPSCTDDAQCTTTGHCNIDANSNNVGSCTTAEICDNGLDEDGDGAVDCEDQADDTTCAADPICIAAIDGACLAAGAAILGDNAGDTTGGVNNFKGSCQAGGAPEQVFTLLPGNSGEKGVLTLELASAADLGVYARGTCNDAATELGCADNEFGGTNEVLTLNIVDAGSAITLFVDGFQAGEEGPFVLTASFAVEVCGDGVVFGSEACDDGNTADGDGCDSACQIEFAFFCSQADTAVLGSNAGDTTNGTALFDANTNNGSQVQDCTFGAGNGQEVLFSFVPATSGNLTLTLSSATDQGVYVRTICEDAGSELGCVDLEVGGTDEVMTLSVNANEPLTIFVDAFDVGEEGPFTLTLALQ